MKNFLIAFALLAVCISCSKDSDSDGADKAVITMDVDGKPWVSSDDGPHSPTGAVVAFNTDMSIIIQGYAENGSYMSITVSSISGPLETGKTYTSVSATDNAQMQYQPVFNGGNAFLSVLSGEGSITFSSVEEGSVNATFEFKGTNSMGQTVTVASGTVEVEN